MDGLGVQLLAGAALALQQNSGIGNGDALGQVLHPHRRGGHRHDVIKGIAGAIGLVDAAQHLAAAGLHRLQLLSGLIGILQEGDHRQAPNQPVALTDGIEIDKIEVLDLLPGDVEDGLPLLQHLGQTGAGAQRPQILSLHSLQGFPQLLAQELQIGAVAEYQPPLGVNNGDTLPHGVKGGSGVSIQLHVALPPFSC